MQRVDPIHGGNQSGLWYVVSWLSVFLLALSLGGCGKSETSAKPQLPVAIDSGDECHVCGMTISHFPGPKGEAYVRGATKPFKFCSTRDLFSWLLQPENKVAATKIYVHDMGSTAWKHPADNAFIDARKAWYVVDQPMKGAMGPTLASFAGKDQAEAFIQAHGGRLLRYQDISLALLAELGDDGHGRP